jgi:hypothetical protein
MCCVMLVVCFHWQIRLLTSECIGALGAIDAGRLAANWELGENATNRDEPLPMCVTWRVLIGACSAFPCGVCLSLTPLLLNASSPVPLPTAPTQQAVRHDARAAVVDEHERRRGLCPGTHPPYVVWMWRASPNTHPPMRSSSPS